MATAVLSSSERMRGSGALALGSDRHPETGRQPVRSPRLCCLVSGGLPEAMWSEFKDNCDTQTYGEATAPWDCPSFAHWGTET